MIEAMATGGGITKGGPPTCQGQFTIAELHSVVAEERKAGLPVAAHAHGTAGIESAVHLRAAASLARAGGRLRRKTLALHITHHHA